MPQPNESGIATLEMQSIRSRNITTLNLSGLQTPQVEEDAGINTEYSL